MPKRIQRKRTKGWRMPEGAVYVGRPTRWGNPFGHAERFHGLELSLKLYESAVHGVWQPRLCDTVTNIEIPYSDYQEFLKRMGEHPLEAMRELRGKDLVCWCRLDQPCHADILLRIANESTGDSGDG